MNTGPQEQQGKVMVVNSRFFNRSELIGFISLALLLLIILPLTLDVFRLNLVAKYLTYAFVAIGLGRSNQEGCEPFGYRHFSDPETGGDYVILRRRDGACEHRSFRRHG